MSLLDKSLFFSAFGNLLEAGFPPIRALSEGMPLPYRGTSRKIIQYIENGSTLWEAMKKCRFSKLEVALTRAGETAGTLPLTCRMLHEYYEECRSLRMKYIIAMIYPMVLYHFSIFIGWLVRSIVSSNAGLTRNEILLLILPWACILGWKFFSPLLHSFPVAAIIEFIPFFGGMQNQLECSRFLTCFGKALDAGISVEEAIRMSGDVCVTGLYQWRFSRIADYQGENHVPFSVILPKYVPMAYDVSAMIKVGEMTGQLPEKAEQGAKVLSGRYKNRVFWLLKFMTGLFFLLGVLKAVLTIGGIWSGQIIHRLDEFL